MLSQWKLESSEEVVKYISVTFLVVTIGNCLLQDYKIKCLQFGKRTRFSKITINLQYTTDHVGPFIYSLNTNKMISRTYSSILHTDEHFY